MTKDGERGWLLCFDNSSHRTWLYRSPWAINLAGVQPKGDSELSLTSRASPDEATYKLVASIRGNEINGNLSVARADERSAHFAIHGVKIGPAIDKSNGFPEGRYSNLNYHAGAGDPTGAELILLLRGTQKGGLVKFNESYWGEPEFVPLSLSNVEVVSREKLKFELKLEDGSTGQYMLERHKNSTTLRRVDVTSTGDIELSPTPAPLP